MAGPQIDLPHGTQVTLRTDSAKHKKGAAGVVTQNGDGPGRFWVDFLDGIHEQLHRNQLTILRLHQKEVFAPDGSNVQRYQEHIVYLAQTGSKAYGLATETSDDDLRGFYVAPLDELLGLRGVPETIELKDPDMAIWEVGKFVKLALNANPNILETMFSPMVLKREAAADLILRSRRAFLSRRVQATYGGYTLSQYKKIEQDLRATGDIRWKHAMHLIRLLLSGIHVLREGEVLIDVGPWRERLLSIRRGEVEWPEVAEWQVRLQTEFNAAAESSALPEYPDYDRANRVLLDVRQRCLGSCERCGLPWWHAGL